VQTVFAIDLKKIEGMPLTGAEFCHRETSTKIPGTRIERLLDAVHQELVRRVIFKDTASVAQYILCVSFSSKKSCITQTFDKLFPRPRFALRLGLRLIHDNRMKITQVGAEMKPSRRGEVRETFAIM